MKFQIKDNAVNVVQAQPFQANTYNIRQYTHTWIDDNTLIIMAADGEAKHIQWTKLNAQDMSELISNAQQLTEFIATVLVGEEDQQLNNARHERGTLLASGFIAGGALMGVVSAGMRFGGFEYSHTLSAGILQLAGIVAYVLLIAYLIWDSMRAKKDIQ